MTTVPRGYWARKGSAHNAALLKRLDRANGAQTSEGKITWQITAVDGVALRGIPAIGPGWAGGAIRGTRPGDGLR